MGKAITTVDMSAVPAHAINAARALGKSFDVNDRVHTRRAVYVNRIMSAGYSIRATAAIVIAAYGSRPSGLSESAIGRYAVVRDILARTDVDTVVREADALDAFVAALVRLQSETPKSGPYAGTKPKDRAVGLADMVAKSAPADVAQVIADALAAFNASDVQAVLADTAPKSRAPHGKELDPADDDDDTPTKAPREVTEADERSRFADAGILAIARELDARLIVKGRGKVTPDRDLLEVFTSIVSKLEAIVAESVGVDA